MPVARFQTCGRQVQLWYQLHGPFAAPHPPQRLGPHHQHTCHENGETEPCAPHRLLVMPGLASRSDTAWVQHITQHMSDLKDAAGGPLVCVCSFDSHGTGESCLPAKPHRLSTQMIAEDALGLMDFLGWDSAHLFGWSMGAMAACKITAMDPVRVNSMSLIGCTRYGIEAGLGLTLWSPFNLLGQLLGKLWRRAGIWAALRRYFSLAWLQQPPQAGGKETRYQVMMRNSLDKSQPNLVMDRTISNKAVVAQELAALWHRLGNKEAERIRESGVPVVAINGSQDGTAPLPAALRLGRALDCPVVVSSAAHVGLMTEKAELVLSILETNVAGRLVSSKEQLQQTKRRAEEAMLQTSFYF